MPTYQYRCSECGEQLEVVQKFTDASLTECPACAGQLRKIYNAVGVVFKGSGFYSTDSRANNGSSGNGSSSNGKSGSDSGSADKSGSSTSESSGSKSSSSESSGSSSTSDSSSATPAKAAAG